jgi:four helix bundle suffix protein
MSPRTYIETRPAQIVANILICLIHQTNYLLDQQLRQLEKAFLKEGGLRERMTRARLSARSKN